jgi:hypothetical protein
LWITTAATYADEPRDVLSTAIAKPRASPAKHYLGDAFRAADDRQPMNVRPAMAARITM